MLAGENSELGKDDALRAVRPDGRASEVDGALVSLVSVSARNRSYLCERVETVAKDESVEIANVHAVSMHVAENMLG